MTDDTFMANLRRMHTYLSTWVAAIASGAAAYWLQLSPVDQQAILAMFPALKALAPMASFVAFIVARGIPQMPKDDADK